jgi:LuxR family maltose regulon positive regulatory protein
MNAMVCTHQHLLDGRIMTKTVETRRGGGKLATAGIRNTLPRAQAMEHLKISSNLELTLVYVPTGYGRTTDLAQVREMLRVLANKSAGVTLVGENSDPLVFTTSVIDTFAQTTDGVDVRARQLLADATYVGPKTIFLNISDYESDITVPIFLIFEEIEQADSCSVVVEMLFDLLKLAPLNLSLALGCRSTPICASISFDSGDQSVRLGATDLRFDINKNGYRLRQGSGHDVGDREVSEVVAAAEGWVYGLQLAGIPLYEVSDSRKITPHRERLSQNIALHIKQRVMWRVPERSVDFLLRSAAVSRLALSLGSLLTVNHNAGECIRWIRFRNVLIRNVDRQPGSHRLDILFAQRLCSELDERRRPDNAQQLDSGARRSLAEKQPWQEAVEQPLLARDTAAAMTYTEEFALRTIATGDFLRVLRWISVLRDHLIRPRIRIRLGRAWCLALSIRAPEVRLCLDQVDADTEDGLLDADASIMNELLAIRSLMAGLDEYSAESTSFCLPSLPTPPMLGTPVEQVRLPRVVFEQGSATGVDKVLEMRAYRGKLVQDWKVPDDIGYCQRVSGLSEFNDGRLHDASRTLESALRCAECDGGRQSVAAVLPAGYLSAIYYEWGELERVRCLQKERFEIALAASSLDSLLRFAQTRARVAALGGDMHSAYSTLEEVELVARRKGCVRLQVACVAESIKLSLMEGKTAQAWRMRGAFDTLVQPELPQEDDSFVETWQCQQKARCRLLLHGGRPQDAVELMQRVHSALKSRGFRWLAAQSAVLLAIALEASAQPDAALILLVEALVYGQMNGLFRTFVDEGYIVAQMLVRLLARRDNPAVLDSGYVGELLAALGVDSSEANSPEEDMVVDSANLSSREGDILRCVGRGLSNKEVARWLGVTPETVKWHLKNIFRKLGVRSRIQAVRVGLEGELHQNGRPSQQAVSHLGRSTYRN